MIHHNEYTPCYAKLLESFYLCFGGNIVQQIPNGGVYMASKERLFSIRTAIAENPKRFSKLVETALFVEKFTALQGDTNKRLNEL